jgi:hypothetical protein
MQSLSNRLHRNRLSSITPNHIERHRPETRTPDVRFPPRARAATRNPAPTCTVGAGLEYLIRAWNAGQGSAHTLSTQNSWPPTVTSLIGPPQMRTCPLIPPGTGKVVTFTLRAPTMAGAAAMLPM